MTGEITEKQERDWRALGLLKVELNYHVCITFTGQETESASEEIRVWNVGRLQIICVHEKLPNL